MLRLLQASLDPLCRFTRGKGDGCLAIPSLE